MTTNRSRSQAVGLAGPLLLPVFLVGLLAGCDQLNAAKNDVGRLTTSKTTAAPARQQAAPVRTSSAKSGTAPIQAGGQGTTQEQAAATAPTASAAPATGEASSSQIAPGLIGRSEIEVQALFGQPSSTEDRPPGKVWHYRDGTCALDVRLFPDVQTRQFGTLSYEVKSDDNSDQGKRACLAQLRTRGSAAR